MRKIDAYTASAARDPPAPPGNAAAQSQSALVALGVNRRAAWHQ